MATENSKRMEDVSLSNLKSRFTEVLTMLDIITSDAGHVVEVTFRNHCNAQDPSSNTLFRK